MRILCYGDSNTWGYISGTDHQRYDNKERWPKLLQKKLGDDYEIIEEGLNSRTLFTDDTRPGKEGRIGFEYLKPCLYTHDKVDIIILMLGTNELKDSFNNSADNISKMLDKFISYITSFKSQIDGSSPALILSGIPPIGENIVFDNAANPKYKNAYSKAQELIKLCKKYNNQDNLIYVDNSDLKTGIDCIHITKESHAILAEKLYTIDKEKL